MFINSKIFKKHFDLGVNKCITERFNVEVRKLRSLRLIYMRDN